MLLLYLHKLSRSGQHKISGFADVYIKIYVKWPLNINPTYKFYLSEYTKQA